VTTWLIVPFSRPEFYANVVANFTRQQERDVRLVVACNRAAAGFTGHVGEFVESEPGLAEPMNAGLRYARQHGRPGDWFCKWDDDDYYGPRALDVVAEGRAQGALVVGRMAVWVRASTGALWFIDGPQQAWVPPGQAPHGPTLAAPLDCADFPHRDDWGEDADWVKAMRATGARVWAGRAGSFAWCRWGPAHGHAWPWPDLALAGLQTYPVLDVREPFSPERVEDDHPGPSAVRVVPDEQTMLREAFSIPRFNQ